MTGPLGNRRRRLIESSGHRGHRVIEAIGSSRYWVIVRSEVMPEL